MQTVIAAFDTRAHAERARDKLVQRGFDRDDVHIEEQASATRLDKRDTTEDTGSGGIAGFFDRLFGSDGDDRHGSTWNEAVRRGSPVLVADVRDEQQAEEVVSCLHECGAIDVDERATQWRAEGWTGGAATSAPLAGDPQVGTGTAVGKDAKVLDVVQEELQVGKRTLDRGGVRVVQRTSQRPVREVVHLRDERAVVDRRPVDRPVQPGELDTFKEGTLEVREKSEEAVVSKKARVVEEVRVSKEVREHDEVIEDKLRRKDVDVERLDGSAARERAVASDRPQQPPVSGRDPDANLPAGRTKPRR